MIDKLDVDDPYAHEPRAELRAARLLIHFLRKDWDGIKEVWTQVESESELPLFEWYYVEYSWPILRILQRHLSTDDAHDLAASISQDIPILLQRIEKEDDNV